jgi:hypothetical protein
MNKMIQNFTNGEALIMGDAGNSKLKRTAAAHY